MSTFSLREMDPTFPLIRYWFILGFFNLLRVYGNAEVDALNALKTQLQDPMNVLQSWNTTQVNPCMWFHITCNYENRVTRIDLQNAGLSGQLVPQLGQLSRLQYLELYANNITGRIPNELGNLTNLVSLDLYMNRLEGDIPDTLGNLQKLRYLLSIMIFSGIMLLFLCSLCKDSQLSNNRLTGTIPNSLTTIDNLQILDLSNNFLTGIVPFNGSFSLFKFTSFANNPNLSFVGLPPFPPLPNPQFPSGGNNDTRAIAEGAAVVVFLLFIGGAVVLAWWWHRKWQDHFTDVPAEEDPKFHLRQLKKFSLCELQVATDSFSKKNILGRGAFGKVYKGRLVDGTLVAVKRLIDRVQSGELQFQTEVELISMAVHRNLLRLQGFCMTSTERLLVYPYMANGSVASCLQDTPTALDWPTRKRIALGSARGLAYLHDDCDPTIIHRDVKAANILLDEEFEAVVGDFGLAKLMDSNDTHVTTGVRGTIGHIAPEYLASGRASERTDVFGYGVMLLELITGQRAFDLARLAHYNEEVMLLDWVKGLPGDKKLDIVMDKYLIGNYLRDEVEELIHIALLCTQVDPTERPKMSQVVKMLECNGLVERWDEWQKEEISAQEFSHIQIHFNADSTYNTSNDHLSGPR